jgi:hypothetical protein
MSHGRAADLAAAPDPVQAAIKHLGQLDPASQQAFLRRLEQRAARSAKLILAPEEVSRRTAKVHDQLHQKTITWQVLHDVIADVDALEKHAIDQLVRRYRRLVFDSFHKQIDTYGERQQAWLDTFEDWKQAGSRFDQQEMLIDWLEAAIRNATPKTMGPIPDEPEFGGPKVTRKYRTTSRPLVRKSVVKPQATEKPKAQPQVAIKSEVKQEVKPRVATKPVVKPQAEKPVAKPQAEKPAAKPQVAVKPEVKLPVATQPVVKPQAVEKTIAKTEVAVKREAKEPPVAPKLDLKPQATALTRLEPVVPPLNRQETSISPRRPDVNAADVEPALGKLPALAIHSKDWLTPPSADIAHQGLKLQPVQTVSVPQPAVIQKTPPQVVQESHSEVTGIPTVPDNNAARPAVHVSKVKRTAASETPEEGPIEVQVDELAARIAGCNLAIRALEADLGENGQWTAARLETLFDRLKILVLRQHDLELFRQTVSKEQMESVGSLMPSKRMISEFAAKIVAVREQVSSPKFAGGDSERQVELRHLEELSRRLAELAQK